MSLKDLRMNTSQLQETPGETMVVAFEAPRHLVEQADRLAEADFLSRSAWLRRMIAERVAKMPNAPRGACCE
jgi:hypothetical protein